MGMKDEEKDYCSDCGTEFTDYHYCELARSWDIEEDEE